MARKNGTGNGSHKSVQDARTDLLARAERNAEGAASCKTDPLGDAKAARAIVEAVREHAAEMARRGLPAPYGEAALELAREIEEHLQAMPAAAVAARGRTPESADLLADAAATAQAIRDGVLRLSRGADGRAWTSPRAHGHRGARARARGARGRDAGGRATRRHGAALWPWQSGAGASWDTNNTRVGVWAALGGTLVTSRPATGDHSTATRP